MTRYLYVALLPFMLSCMADGGAERQSSDVWTDVTLVLEHRIELQEQATDPIVDLDRVHASPEGPMVFADRRASRIRVFDAAGSRVAALGRRGAGPGEFRNVTDVAFDSRGGLVAVDQATGRVTRFDAGFRLDTTLALPSAHPHRVQPVGDDVVITLLTEPRLIRLSAEMELGDHVLADSVPFRVPYWGSILKTELATLGGDLLVALNLVYPVWRLGAEGTAFDSLVSSPASFVRASEPAVGQFVGVPQPRVWDWLRSFDTIDRVAVLGDSLLIVVHGRFDPLQGDPWRVVHTTLDLYDADGRRLAAEVPLPGRFLGAGDAIYVLESMPPEPWAVGVYGLRRRGH